MREWKTLTMEEYCRLFEHIILAEYDNLFRNAGLRQDLGLEDTATAPFLIEYLSAALYLLEDVAPDSRLPEPVASELVSRVRAQVFRRILPEDALHASRISEPLPERPGLIKPDTLGILSASGQNAVFVNCAGVRGHATMLLSKN